MTKLVVDLDGVDPDEAFSVVPYEKGSTLLWYLEDLVGGPGKIQPKSTSFQKIIQLQATLLFSEIFEPFLKSYLENFKYQSIDTCKLASGASGHKYQYILVLLTV